MKKITFRQVKPADFNSVYRWVKAIEKEDTFITINAAEPIALKEEKAYFKDLFKKIKQKKAVKLAVFDGKKYLGSCDIEKGGKRQGHIGNFGIALSKSCRGQGIGFRLARETIKLVQKKLGFKQYSRHPRAVFYKGKYIDTVRFYKDL